MPEPAVVTAMREFKVGLLAREQVQMQQMAKRWLTVERALDADINLLARELGEAREAGESTSAAKVYRLERYKRLQAEAQREIRNYVGWADQTITNGQGQMAELGLSHSAQGIQMSYWPGVGAQFDRLPIEAVQHMVGICADGKPVGNLLKRRMLPAEGVIGWRKLTNELVEGTARGRNPRQTAERMRDALTGGLQKALVIARSEQLRVYRQVGLDQYNSSGVVLGQKRLAAHDGRVCVACIADDGTLYNLTYIISDHPNGRCTSVPVVEGMPEVTWSAGQDWFDKQDDATQRSIMGDERWDAYKDGQIRFDQMGAPTFDPIWGGGLRVVSLPDLLEAKRPKAVPIDLRTIKLPEPPKTLHEMGEPYIVHLMGEEMAGASISYVTEWEDGTKAIFKPVAAEQEGMGALITDAYSEVAAYRLAELLGYDAVPETEFTRYAIGARGYVNGSTQRWVENAQTALELSSAAKRQEELIVQRTKMALFDEVIANGDRHFGNMLTDEKAKLWAIDHGRALQGGALRADPNLKMVIGHGSFWEWGEVWPEIPDKAIAAAQKQVMRDTLNQWGTISQAEVQRVMAQAQKGELGPRVWERIQSLQSQLEEIP